MALILPNTIENDTAADAAELQQNFSSVQTYVNTNVLHRDGSVALIAPILLPGDPTQPNHAANKEYVDDGDATAAAATALKLPLAGGTVTGQIKGITPVAADDLTRKDYVDGRDTAVTNAANTRMDAQDAAFQTATLNAAYARADLKVAKTGDTMTGPLTIARTDDNHCLQLSAPNHATPYLSWHHGATLGAYSQVNFSTGVWDNWLNPDWTMRWLIAGTEEMRLTRASGLVILDKVNCSYSPTSGSWANANFIAQSDGGNGSRSAIRHGGTVAQWRMHSSVGQMECLNADATGFIGIRGGAYTNASALKIKKDVRPLREGSVTAKGRSAERAPLSADADTVEAPDIMALRPIIYRHAAEPQCVVVDEDGEQIGVEPEPADTVRGREGRREHIGLIADEVQHIIPSAVAHDADGEVVGIDYAQITVALLDHVQTLTERIAALEAAK